MKILIAEESNYIRKLFQKKFTEWGYDVAVARDGKQALRTMKADKYPRLVILDWMIPCVGGCTELIGKIRKNADQAYIYLIIITSKSGKDDIIKAME
ncbi:MAG: response regulator, partial [Gemmatimonadota bacterium]|nr:response regulator [Gemmatimonadota bacterium]